MSDTLGKIDKTVFLSSLVMLGFGIVFVYSSSFAIAQHKFGGSDFFLARHIVRAFIALVCFILFMNIDYHILGNYSNYAYLCAVAMLIYTLTLPESEAVNGAKRWISIGQIRFQVSEFARIALMLVLAKQLDKNKDKNNEFGILFQQVIRIGIICSLVVLEPDFSTAFIIGLISFCLLFVSGAKILHLAGVCIPIVVFAISSVIMSPYRYNRLIGFFDSKNNIQGIGYQTFQSLVGLGNGRVFGAGLGQGEQKHFYLPEPHTDFVFSILGEEIGFVGLLIVFSIFLLLVYRGMVISCKAPDTMGQILAFGLTIMISFYFLLHSFVNTGIVPTTGVPLPFLSYGGMSLIFTMSSMGILLNISSQSYHESSVKRKNRKP